MRACSEHIAACYACRRDRARLAWLRRFLADPESVPVDWRRDVGRVRAIDETAHKAHLTVCDTCQAVADDLARHDQEVEQRAMEVAARVVWPQSGSRLPPPDIARRCGANGWREP